MLRLVKYKILSRVMSKRRRLASKLLGEKSKGQFSCVEKREHNDALWCVFFSHATLDVVDIRADGLLDPIYGSKYLATRNQRSQVQRRRASWRQQLRICPPYASG
jgi:hypothetical protein